MPETPDSAPRLSRTARVTAALATAKTAYDFYTHLKQQYDAFQERHTRQFSVSIPSTDDVYPVVQDRVQGYIPLGEQTAFLVKTNLNRRNGPPAELNYSLLTDETTIQLDGHPVKLSAPSNPRPRSNRAEDPTVAPEFDSGPSTPLSAPPLTFTASTPEGLQATRRFLQHCTEEYVRRYRAPSVRVSGNYGWSLVNSGPPRPLDTVILPESTLEDIVQDVTTFQASEQRYSNLGLPWHRSYLFHGPPGTGKTSTARALAAHLGLDLFYLPLGNTAHRTRDLADEFSGITERGILLLEDVDRTTTPLTELLNALDGVTTPHGLVTIYTTNHPDRLDPALTRPGRTDRHILFPHLDTPQFKRLVQHICPHSPPAPELPPHVSLSPAEVVEWAKPYLHDSAKAYETICNELQNVLELSQTH